MTAQRIAIFPATLLLNVNANVTELLNIPGYSLPVAANIILLQVCKDIPGRGIMLGICF